jgi:hypothetical protein
MVEELGSAAPSRMPLSFNDDSGIGTFAHICAGDMRAATVFITHNATGRMAGIRSQEDQLSRAFNEMDMVKGGYKHPPIA